MWTAVLSLVGPLWSVIKPYWKYFLGASILIALCWFSHRWYERKLDEAYERGVAVTEAKDAKVLEQRERDNAQLVAELTTSVAVKQAELEGKLHANELVANDLRTQLRTHRVCSDERSGRAVSRDPGSPVKIYGAAEHAGSAEPAKENSETTVGDDLVTIGEECQSSTDKLITLQNYVKDLMTKLKRIAEKSRVR